MARMEVETKINIYEEDGSDSFSDKKLSVKSHDDDSDMVVLVVGTKTFTVVGADLEKAISNARNVRSS